MASCRLIIDLAGQFLVILPYVKTLKHRTMKQFFKFMFASFLGTLLTLLVIVFIFIGMIAGMVSMTEDEEVKVKPNSVLHVQWTSPIKDRSSENPFEGFDFNKMESNKPVGLNTILKNLDKAAKDPNIDGIFLDMETVPAGMATLEEIRDKLVEFKESGKFIISYANNYDQKAYYLASTADEVYLNPKGMILFKGLNAQLMFLKGLLDKLDVDMQIIRGPNNKYKSAVEPLLLDKMSEANREQMEMLLNSAWKQILLAISESRNISLEELNRIADKLELLQELCIVSSLQLAPAEEAAGKLDFVDCEDVAGLQVAVHPAPGEKCERCWTISTTVGADEEHPALCTRCAAVVRSLAG
jgi:protease-4